MQRKAGDFGSIIYVVLCRLWIGKDFNTTPMAGGRRTQRHTTPTEGGQACMAGSPIRAPTGYHTSCGRQVGQAGYLPPGCPEEHPKKYRAGRRGAGESGEIGHYLRRPIARPIARPNSTETANSQQSTANRQQLIAKSYGHSSSRKRVPGGGFGKGVFCEVPVCQLGGRYPFNRALAKFT